MDVLALLFEAQLRHKPPVHLPCSVGGEGLGRVLYNTMCRWVYRVLHRGWIALARLRVNREAGALAGWDLGFRLGA